jgi:hypothetical protein
MNHHKDQDQGKSLQSCNYSCFKEKETPQAQPKLHREP